MAEPLPSFMERLFLGVQLFPPTLELRSKEVLPASFFAQFFNKFAIEGNCGFQILAAPRQRAKRNVTIENDEWAASSKPLIKRDRSFLEKLLPLADRRLELVLLRLFLPRFGQNQ